MTNDDDSRTAAIKPCPLCGGERIKAHYIRDGQTLGCQDCGCSVRAFNPRAGHKNINLWNTRDLADPIQLAAAERRGIERAAEVISATAHDCHVCWRALDAIRSLTEA